MLPLFPRVVASSLLLNISQDASAQESLIRSLVSDPFLKLQFLKNYIEQLTNILLTMV